MQGAKMEDTCREKAQPGTPGPQECIQAHLDPAKIRLWSLSMQEG